MPLSHCHIIIFIFRIRGTNVARRVGIRFLLRSLTVIWNWYPPLILVPPLLLLLKWPPQPHTHIGLERYHAKKKVVCSNSAWHNSLACPIFEFRILRTCRKGKHINYMLSFFPLSHGRTRRETRMPPEIAFPYFQRARHHSSRKCSIFFQK